jgi:D-aminopeptidase
MPRMSTPRTPARKLSAFAIFVIFVIFVLAAAPGSARQGKRVYISVDDQTSAGQPEYARARKLMAEDANAAIRGAFDGGATHVLVNDSHGGQRNLLPEDLDPRASLISHSFKRHGMMEGLDDTFDAVVFVGYHAKADAPSSPIPAPVWCVISRSTAGRWARAA